MNRCNRLLILFYSMVKSKSMSSTSIQHRSAPPPPDWSMIQVGSQTFLLYGWIHEWIVRLEMNFDIDMFQEYLEQLISSDSSSSSPSSSATDSEPATREMGTDPMVEMAPPAQPVISQTTKPLRLVSTTQLNQFLNQPIIIFHQSGSKPTMNNTPASISLVAMEEYPPTETETTVSTEIFGTMTPSPSNDSSDEGISSSPDAAHEPNNGSMVTDLTVRDRTSLFVSLISCLRSSRLYRKLARWLWPTKNWN